MCRSVSDRSLSDTDLEASENTSDMEQESDYVIRRKERIKENQEMLNALLQCPIEQLVSAV